MLREIIDNPVQMDENGMMDVPQGPGLGITVNEKAIEKYRIYEW